MSNSKPRNQCAVEDTVDAIGGKWKPILLYHLIAGAKRYSELKRLLASASDRMLARSLRELEQAGLVERAMFAEVPVRVEYSLSPEGRSLIPILEAMNVWGATRA